MKALIARLVKTTGLYLSTRAMHVAQNSISGS
jgi:hypothetical protein